MKIICVITVKRSWKENDEKVGNQPVKFSP